MSTADAELVKRCLREDRDAFDLLIRRYQDAVYGLALSYTRDFADAEDLAQEAFVSAYLELATLRDPSKFGSWLKSTVVHLCLNWRRSHPGKMVPIDAVPEKMLSDVPRPDELQEARDLRARVLDAIGRLSERNREAVTLYYIDGLSKEEIGAFLDVSPAALNQRLHRAREQLKEGMMAMVEDVLRESRPEGFPEKVLQEIADRASKAREEHAYADSMRYCDEALEMLGDLDESDQQRRWRGEMLWSRAHSSRLLTPGDVERVLEDMEASLALAEEIGDRRTYAEHLNTLGHVYVQQRKYDKALEGHETALSIFRKIGDEKGQAWSLYWIGYCNIPGFIPEKTYEGDFVRSLESFRDAVDLFRRTEDRRGEAMGLAAVRFLEEIGEHPDPEAISTSGAGCMLIERSSTALTWKTQHGFNRTDGGFEAMGATLEYAMFPLEHLLWFPVRLGEQRTDRCFSFGMKEMRLTSSIESLDDVMHVPAGTFTECLKMKTVFEQVGEEPDDFYRRLNEYTSGEQYLWFAPGTGLVKVLRCYGDGMESEVLLTECAVPGQHGDYFPLELGASWQYQGTTNRSEYAVQDVCWVATRDEDMFYMAQFTTSEKRA